MRHRQNRDTALLFKLVFSEDEVQRVIARGASPATDCCSFGSRFSRSWRLHASESEVVRARIDLALAARAHCGAGAILSVAEEGTAFVDALFLRRLSGIEGFFRPLRVSRDALCLPRTSLFAMAFLSVTCLQAQDPLAYDNWFINEFWRFVFAQQEVGKYAQTFLEYPPMQEGASFNMYAERTQQVRE